MVASTRPGGSRSASTTPSWFSRRALTSTLDSSPLTAWLYAVTALVSALPTLSTWPPSRPIRSYSSRPRSNTARAFSDRAACCQAYWAVRSRLTRVVGVAMCTFRDIAYSSRPAS